MSKLLPINDPYKLKLADKMRDVVVYKQPDHMPVYIPTSKVAERK